MISIPVRADELTPTFLTTLIQEQHPGAVVEQVEVLKAMQYGDGMVSTSARATLSLRYRAGTGRGLPTRVVYKMAYDLEFLPWPLYANEVRFYRELQAEQNIEVPLCLAAVYDPATYRFALLLEDLTERGVSFPNALSNVGIEVVKNALDVLARLHARYWQSPRFGTDLAGLETHVSGTLNDFMIGQVPAAIEQEIAVNPFKQELLSKLATTADELLAGMVAMQRHQATLPQTLLHGDSHIGNIYLLPDGRAGLLDWQLMVRGYCMHDINYLITTALTIDQRRGNEQDLLRYYLQRLKQAGVDEPPSFASAWDEYRRTLIWGVYIGWLTTSVVNYGWEINTVNLLRLSTAYADLGTAELVAEVM
ncbi:MAG: hypothetical protein CMK32_01965 [Porticoccaceae bacterium]|nr:hypothetical protein [Porticoccaceae bacterium]